MKIDVIVHDYIVAHISANGSVPDDDTIDLYIDAARTVLRKVQKAEREIEQDNRRRSW